MAFTSATFFIFISAVVLLVSATRSIRARAYLMCAANGVFLWSCADRPVELVPLLVFIAVGYALVEGLRRTRSPALLWLGLLVVLGSFVTLKKYAFVPTSFTLHSAYQVVGLSYVLFRVLHLMIDAKQGELQQRLTPLSFFNYTASFLTLTAGPIQRYPDYARETSVAPALDEARVYEAFARIVTGFLRIAVVSAVFNYLFASVSTKVLPGPAPTLGLALLGTYLASAVFYCAFLYANFAGYMDVVIGVGSLLGLKLPENFDRPFQARNFLDFWARWHITLSQWFRTYLFNPLLRVLAARVSSPKLTPYLAVGAFFITFLLMGIWHGGTSVFVVYGLFMGAGASFNKLWQLLASKRLGKATYKAWCEKPPIIYTARGLTFAYFTLGLSCLWLSLPELSSVGLRLGAARVLFGYFGLALTAGAAFWFWDALQAGWSRLAERAPASSVATRNLLLASQILLILSISSFFHKAPEFVYRAF